MSGPARNLEIGWELIRKGVTTEEPTPAGKYLGCDRVEGSIADGAVTSMRLVEDSMT